MSQGERILKLESIIKYLIPMVVHSNAQELARDFNENCDYKNGSYFEPKTTENVIDNSFNHCSWNRSCSECEEKEKALQNLFDFLEN